MDADAGALFSTGLTCITCRLAFSSADIQKEHYRSEWHRYNVKRQITSLPPISLEEFKAKEAAFGEAKKGSGEPDGDMHCRACQKTYKSKNAYDNHLRSKKHQESLALMNVMEEEMGSTLEIRPKERVKYHAREANASMEQEGGVEEAGGNVTSASPSTSENEEEDVDEDGSEPAFLVLPSGGTIGHRSLFRYFRQHLKPIDKVQPKQERQRGLQFSDKKLKALGWTGVVGRPEAAQIARDTKFFQRTMSKYQQRLTAKSNRLFVDRGRDDQQ